MTGEFLFPTQMLKACWFTTLRDVGFRTTVGLHNPLPLSGFEAQNLHLSVKLFNSDGQHIVSRDSIAVLRPNERITLDVDVMQVELNLQGDCVGLISMIPERYLHTTEVAVTASEIVRWTAICDEFIGYTHSTTGTQSGVHYQSPPMNDARLKSTNTMIIQSPKVIVTNEAESYLLVFAPSSDKNFSSPTDIKIVLVDPSGQVIARGSTTVPARGRRLLKVSDLFGNDVARDRFMQDGGIGMLIGLAQGAVVTPLSLVADRRGGLAIDHTLPPPYYIPWWGGEARKAATDQLVKRFFS